MHMSFDGTRPRSPSLIWVLQGFGYGVLSLSGVRSSIASINKLFHRDPITTYRLLKHAIIALRPTSTDVGLGSTWG